MVKRNGPHFKTGDAQPPLQKGLLRLYSMFFCPFAQRAILVLDMKKVPYDIVNCNLGKKPEWLVEKSNGGKVPTIEFEDGHALSESLIVSDFLDEAYPEPPLYPRDPRAKAYDRLLIERFSAAIGAFYKVVLNENGYTSANFEEFVQTLEVYEKELKKRGTTFFAGARPGMLDLMIFPWMERAPAMQLIGGAPFELPKARLPTLLTWREAMVADPAVALSVVPPNIFKQFMETRKGGGYNFDFDFLL